MTSNYGINEFAIQLHLEGVLEAPRVERGEDASDLGRKWRAALSQLELKAIMQSQTGQHELWEQLKEQNK